MNENLRQRCEEMAKELGVSFDDFMTFTNNTIRELPKKEELINFSEEKRGELIVYAAKEATRKSQAITVRYFKDKFFKQYMHAKIYQEIVFQNYLLKIKF